MGKFLAGFGVFHLRRMQIIFLYFNIFSKIWETIFDDTKNYFFGSRNAGELSKDGFKR